MSAQKSSDWCAPFFTLIEVANRHADANWMIEANWQGIVTALIWPELVRAGGGTVFVMLNGVFL